MKTSSRLSLLLPSLALLGVACDDPLPEAWQVDGFRVLAVRAEPPEVAPGTTVELDALVVDPTGGPPPRMTWYACIMPEAGVGFFGGSSETSSSGGEGTPLSTDPYGGSCAARALAGEPFTELLGEGPTATLEVPSDLLDDDRALKQAYGLDEDLEIPAEVQFAFLGIAGVNYTVSLVTELPGGERLESMKRVNVSQESLVEDNARNLNPTDLAVHIAVAALDVTPPATAPTPADGACFTEPGFVVVPGERYALNPINVPSPQTKYAVLLPGLGTGEAFEVRTTEETYFYAFFTTVGSLAKEDSKAPGEPRNTWRIPKSAAGTADLWIVLRDGRGGVSWCHSAVPIGAAP
ncbi:MAG: hypothetical protein IT385_07390 [Deltaproteobacteria bacterium]|nr:hypothetical protein [Deltaproteobacteria bacterium]